MVVETIVWTFIYHIRIKGMVQKYYIGIIIAFSFCHFFQEGKIVEKIKES